VERLRRHGIMNPFVAILKLQRFSQCSIGKRDDRRLLNQFRQLPFSVSVIDVDD
jgi:hypothetical protein